MLILKDVIDKMVLIRIIVFNDEDWEEYPAETLKRGNGGEMFPGVLQEKVARESRG